MARSINSRGVKNANSTAALTPASVAGGGLALLALEYNGNDADITGFTGTMTGTWTKVGRVHNGSWSLAVYASTDYGTSGTIAYSATGSSWRNSAFIEYADPLNGMLTGGGAGATFNYKTGTKVGGAGATFTLTLDAAPTHTTFLFATTDATASAGAGMTELVDDLTWSAFHVLYSTSASGVQAVSAVSTTTNRNDGVALEVAYDPVATAGRGDMSRPVGRAFRGFRRTR